MSLLEIVAATLLVLGSVLVIRALMAADLAQPSSDASRTERDVHSSARSLRRAA